MRIKTPVMNIILFDGICNLCNGTVRFLLKRDRRGVFRFASLQSDAGKNLLYQFHISEEKMNTLFYIRNTYCFRQSTAILEILNDLGGGWKLLYPLKWIPSFIRDHVYNIIAANRYKLFGKKSSCMIPSPKIKDRFL